MTRNSTGFLRALAWDKKKAASALTEGINLEGIKEFFDHWQIDNNSIDERGHRF